ncbi:MAG: (2Fe-2S) ferredoxin domain-containing protein [Anaerolineaceae bacterium]
MTQQSKSLEELKRICEEARASLKSKEPEGRTEIVVGMGTVGIAAGARETLKAILDYIEQKNLEGVTVRQTGNIGIDSYEPVVQVTLPQHDKVTYGRVTPEIARFIMDQHVRHGQVVDSFVVKG